MGLVFNLSPSLLILLMKLNYSNLLIKSTIALFTTIPLSYE